MPSDPSAAYRKAAAAVAALDERRRTIAALRARGAVAIPPGRLAGMLADAYLDIKATGRL